MCNKAAADSSAMEINRLQRISLCHRVEICLRTINHFFYSVAVDVDTVG